MYMTAPPPPPPLLPPACETAAENACHATARRGLSIKSKSSQANLKSKSSQAKPQVQIKSSQPHMDDSMVAATSRICSSYVPTLAGAWKAIGAIRSFSVSAKMSRARLAGSTPAP